MYSAEYFGGYRSIGLGDIPQSLSSKRHDVLQGALFNADQLTGKTAQRWIKRYGDAIRADSSKLVLVQLRLEPLADDADRSGLLAALKPLTNTANTPHIVSFVCDDWLQEPFQEPSMIGVDDPSLLTPLPPRDTDTGPFTKRAVVFFLLATAADTMSNHVFCNSTVAGLLAASSAHEMVYTVRRILQ